MKCAGALCTPAHNDITWKLYCSNIIVYCPVSLNSKFVICNFTWIVINWIFSCLFSCLKIRYLPLVINMYNKNGERKKGKKNKTNEIVYVKTMQCLNKSNYLCWLVSHSLVMFVLAVRVCVVRPIRMHSNPIVHLGYFDRFSVRFPETHLRLYHRWWAERKKKKERRKGEHHENSHINR